MEETKQLQFRITHWPQQPLSLWPVIWTNTFTFDSDDRCFRLVDDRWRALPNTGELYLELAHLDLDDLRAVARFGETYGILGIRNPGLTMRAAGLARWPSVRDELRESWPQRDRELLRSGAATNADVARFESEESLDEFLFGARLIKNLVSAWQVTKGNVAADQAPWADIPIVRRPSDRRSWTSWLSTELTQGLEPFRPRLLLVPLRPAAAPDDLGHALSDFPWEDARPALFSFLCLQLFNHIAEQSSYRTCRHCGRLFVRQKGRSRAGQYRTSGVVYCSSSCANSEAQRRYRARKRERRVE